MGDLQQRIAALPSEKRQLLERLLAAEKASISPGYERHRQKDAQPEPREHALLHAQEQPLSLAHRSDAEIKTLTRRFYNTISRQLNSHIASQHALFLNYGYAADDSREYAQVALPAYCLNRNTTKLVLEVVGDCRIDGLSILDVGCGRGGTIATLARYFPVGELIGLDLSPEAVTFCMSTHCGIAATFLEGDAEALPFDDQRFGAVINIESSHNYPHLQTFYDEVYRVLRPGGFFLYADAFHTDRIAGHLAYLRRLGFCIEHERDITGNVLGSCDETANLHMEAFDQANDAEVMQAFLAAPGSPTYRALADRQATYQILRLRKGT